MGHVEKCSKCAGTGRVVPIGTTTAPSQPIACPTCQPWGSRGWVMESGAEQAASALAAEAAAHAETKEEAARLRAIVDRLPKTADGVVITPGMVVFYHSPAGIIETPPLDSWSEIEGTLMEDEDAGPVNFYSTRAAAEAAKEEPC